jgi:CRP-like cAMP-binding protein
VEPTLDASSAQPAAQAAEPGCHEAFERRVAAGATVFEEGDAGRTLFVIQSGQVELTRRNGDAGRLVARLGPGEFFGEMSVLLGQPRSVRAVAVSDAQLLEIDGSLFEAMCVEQPEVAIRVIQRLAARVIDLEQRLTALGVDDLLRPVVRVLLRRAEPEDGGHRVPLRLGELASEAGLSMLEAHRALGQLFDRKLVRLTDEVLRVADLEALSASLD